MGAHVASVRSQAAAADAKVVIMQTEVLEASSEAGVKSGTEPLPNDSGSGTDPSMGTATFSAPLSPDVHESATHAPTAACCSGSPPGSVANVQNSVNLSHALLAADDDGPEIAM